MDTGVNREHPDLDDLFGYDGNDLVSPWWRDTDGHGTHVTGTIAANDNQQGVVGVAPEGAPPLARRVAELADERAVPTVDGAWWRPHCRRVTANHSSSRGATRAFGEASRVGSRVRSRRAQRRDVGSWRYVWPEGAPRLVERFADGGEAVLTARVVRVGVGHL